MMAAIFGAAAEKIPQNLLATHQSLYDASPLFLRDVTNI